MLKNIFIQIKYGGAVARVLSINGSAAVLYWKRDTGCDCMLFGQLKCHLKSLHWLKITQRIQFEILSLTYNSLQFKQPSSILDLLKIQRTHSTRSSAVVILQRPSNSSRLKITDKSFYHQAPALWNSLPKHLRALSSTSPKQTNYYLLLLSSSQFYKQLKTYLFLQSHPP